VGAVRPVQAILTEKGLTLKKKDIEPARNTEWHKWQSIVSTIVGFWYSHQLPENRGWVANCE
jgi:hypothetical protein